MSLCQHCQGIVKIFGPHPSNEMGDSDQYVQRNTSKRRRGDFKDLKRFTHMLVLSVSPGFTRSFSTIKHGLSYISHKVRMRSTSFEEFAPLARSENS